MNTENINSGKENHPKQITFFIEKEKFTVEVETLTVKQLLEDYAKEDSTKTTLGLKEGNKTPKYTDLNASVELKNGMHFVIFHNEPTPVS
jgi:hypothetical protein